MLPTAAQLERDLLQRAGGLRHDAHLAAAGERDLVDLRVQAQRLAQRATPGPVMTLSTPGGMPAALASRAMISADSGVLDASTTVLPVTSAWAIFHNAIM